MGGGIMMGRSGDAGGGVGGGGGGVGVGRCVVWGGGVFMRVGGEDGGGGEQTGWAKGEVKLGVGHGVMQPARIAIYGSDIAL